MIRLLLLLFPFLFFAQVPAYYNSVNFELSGNDLKNELATLITTTHTTELEYTSSSATDVWDVLKQTDLLPNDANTVFLLYGFDDTDGITKNDMTRDKDLSCHTSSCTGLWNREHVFPKSLATPALTTDYPSAGTDAHSLRSCDGQMNSSRNNRPYASGNGTAHITSNGNWYPGDEWKGDVARMIMYMYVRYPSQCVANATGVGGSTYAPYGDMPDIFLEWNKDDPVSQYELNRNDILETEQGNRNPFIDNPYLATKIWSGPIATDSWGVLTTHTFSLGTSVTVYPTVTENVVYVESNSSSSLLYNLYDITGKKLKEGEVRNPIDLSKNTMGIYLLTIYKKQTGDKITTKIVKK